MTNTQTDVVGRLKAIITAQNKQLGYTEAVFQVMEFPGERWCSIWSISVRAGDVNNQREYILWIGPRGRVIQLKSPGGPSLPMSLEQPGSVVSKPTEQPHTRHGSA